MTKPIHIHTFPSSTVAHNSALFIAEFLDEQLNAPTFLLLSGGSAIAMYKEMIEILLNKKTDLKNLTVSLFDERFVSKNSPDSNEQQLRDAGVIDQLTNHGATWIPYLGSDNKQGDETAQKVNKKFSEELKNGKELIILAGIGDDGHTAGLLPTKSSEIITSIFESKKFITYYELTDEMVNPFRQRLTTTPKLIEQAKQVIIYAVGEKKLSALKWLMDSSESVSDCPCLLLTKSQNPVILLTDQII